MSGPSDNSLNLSAAHRSSLDAQVEKGSCKIETAVRCRMGKVVIDEQFCKGCTLCISACPQHLLRIAKHVSGTSYHPAECFDPECKCTGCGLCALICPDAAIQVYREKKTVVK
jgi:2-oxoglutarate ferredoxin oxidoreductase subunit delta